MIWARRTYAPHRRAYVPRLWPMLLVSVPVAATLPNVFGVWGFLIAMVWAFLLPQARLWVWRRRHPVISAEEYARDWLDRQREAARWN